jgi:hypothetical protein
MSGDARLISVEQVSASYSPGAVTITLVRYACNPDLPADEGTRRVDES